MENLSSEQLVSKVLDKEVDSICEKFKDDRCKSDNACTLSSRKRQVRCFLEPFRNIPELFDSFGPKKRYYTLSILGYEKYWENVDKTMYLKLNTQKAAKKIVKEGSPDIYHDHLNNFSRYQIACWFCLTDQIEYLFNEFMELHKNEKNFSKKKLSKSLVGRVGESDLMVEYWSYYYGDCFYKVKSEGRTDPWLIGLDYALAMPHKQLDAVKFFWRKILSGSPSGMQQEKILIQALTRALLKTDDKHFKNMANIFDYIFDEMDYLVYAFFFEDELSRGLAFRVFEKLVEDCHFTSAEKMFNILNKWEWTSDVYTKKLSELMEKLSHKKCHREEVGNFLGQLLSEPSFTHLMPSISVALREN